jgi:hypothetical protein
MAPEKRRDRITPSYEQSEAGIIRKEGCKAAIKLILRTKLLEQFKRVEEK